MRDRCLRRLLMQRSLLLACPPSPVPAACAPSTRRGGRGLCSALGSREARPVRDIGDGIAVRQTCGFAAQSGIQEVHSGCPGFVQFATLAPELAEAKGVSLRLISVVFLVIVAVAVAEAAQVVGILLVFALMVGPSAASLRMTSRVGWGVGLAVLHRLANKLLDRGIELRRVFP
jgi:hypothetical protein